MQRGKVLWEKDLEELKGNWARYLDKDGDGIPYRTIPGNKHAASSYFTRGTGHDEQARYTEDATTWRKMMDRLKKKYNTARKYVPAPVMHKIPKASLGVIAYGSTESAVLEAIHELSTAHDLKCDFMRIRSLPFTDEVTDFINGYDQILVVEMNRDGQMGQILTMEYPDQAAKIKSVAFGDGLPASAKWVREGILSLISSNGKGKESKLAIKQKKTVRKQIPNNRKSKTSITRKKVALASQKVKKK
jgi:2-oxoglutarate ferredoxin oxidoreductase subunit alpha